MIIKRDFLYSPTTQNRPLHIWLPDDYYETDERYPVMYFFDGHNLYYDKDATYGKSWGLKEFMDNWGKDMIIVGVECSMTNRLVEYCPYHFTKGFLGEIVGTGETTMRWIIDEVKPMIDCEFRTMPFRECTAIGGASMGGLMSLYAAVRHNRWFSKAACLSSTIGPCMEDFREDIAQNAISADTRVYLSWGTEEGGGSSLYPRNDTNRSMEGRNADLAQRIGLHGAATRIYGQPGGHHCEADWEKQVPSFMNFLWCNG